MTAARAQEAMEVAATMNAVTKVDIEIASAATKDMVKIMTTVKEADMVVVVVVAVVSAVKSTAVEDSKKVVMVALPKVVVVMRVAVADMAGTIDVRMTAPVAEMVLAIRSTVVETDVTTIDPVEATADLGVTETMIAVKSRVDMVEETTTVGRSPAATGEETMAVVRSPVDTEAETMIVPLVGMAGEMATTTTANQGATAVDLEGMVGALVRVKTRVSTLVNHTVEEATKAMVALTSSPMRQSTLLQALAITAIQTYSAWRLVCCPAIRIN